MTLAIVALLSYSAACALVSPPIAPKDDAKKAPASNDAELLKKVDGLRLWHEQSQLASRHEGEWSDDKIMKYLAYTRRFWIDFRRLLHSSDDPNKAERVSQKLKALGAREGSGVLSITTLRTWAADLAQSRETLPQRVADADPRHRTLDQTKARIAHLIRTMERDMKGLREDAIDEGTPSPDVQDTKRVAKQ